MKTYYVDCTGNPALRDELLDYAVERGAKDIGHDKYKEGHHDKWPCAWMSDDGVWCGIIAAPHITGITQATWKRKVRKIWGGKKTKPSPKKAAPKKATKPTPMDMMYEINGRVIAMEALIIDRLHQISEELERTSQRAHQARTNSRGNTLILNRIESTLAVLRSGASFMQQLEQDAPSKARVLTMALALNDDDYEWLRKHMAKIPEQDAPKPIGLQPGDYCEASKEVADELTAMGWKWYDSDRCEHRFIVRRNKDAACAEMINTNTKRRDGETLLDRDTFLARARVTAAELGLTGAAKEEPVKEPEPWKPQVGDLVVVKEEPWAECPYKVGDIARVEQRDSYDPWLPAKGDYSAGICVGDSDLRPATPEEVAAHLAAEEAKKVPKFGDRVMYMGKEYRIGCDEPTSLGEWLLCPSNAATGTRYLTRKRFTIIDNQ